MDTLSKTQRSANMRAVHSKHTGPEMAVRRAAHRLGLRFRLHRDDLPGRPDLVFPKWRTVVFVNGCFWHGHMGCRRSKLPSSNVDFWREKLSRNRQRDRKNYRALRKMGWHVALIWQCNIGDDRAAAEAVKRITTFVFSVGRHPRRHTGGPAGRGARRQVKHEGKNDAESGRR
jgi:DNA mismatch endonuclease (patch repair protein)